MGSNQWPWSIEEEARWEEELRQSGAGEVEELIDHLINNSLGGAAYDPLQEESEEEEILVP